MARPTDWDESKERHQIRLTPTCWRHLGDIAAANDLPSRAEAIEYLSRYAVKQSLVFEQDDISLEAIASLDTFATQLNISRSEFVERLARGDGEAIALLTAKHEPIPESEPANKKKGRSLHELRKLMGTHEPAQTRKAEER